MNALSVVDVRSGEVSNIERWEDRSIFRPEALRHYVASREAIGNSKLEQPGRFGVLWSLLILLLFAAAILCSVQVRMPSEGSARPTSRSVVSLLSDSTGEVLR